MNLKIALVQHKAVANNIVRNVELAKKYCNMAKQKGASIVLFPEMWSNAYTPPLSVAQAIDDTYIKAFCETAKSLSIAIVITAITCGEKKPRNTAFVIDKNGDVLLKYDKVHTCDFGYESALESGDKFKTCVIEGVSIGIMICYDREFPESARLLMLSGAEIILVPNACDLNPARLNQFSARAFENMVGVAMANYPAKGWGQSCAYSPVVFDDDGQYKNNTIFSANDIDEDVFIAEFDITTIREYRENETWGNAYRKVNTYKKLIDSTVNYPFVRNRQGEKPE